MANPTFYQQVKDYVTALKQFISTATGVPLNRIIFAPESIAHRKIKEREQRENPLNCKTVEIDKFISLSFPFVTPGYQDNRVSPMQAIYGAIAQASRRQAWNINEDIAVQVEIWGGPAQDGKEYVVNNQFALKNYLYRHQRLEVQFTDIITKDPDVIKPFDVNCWYVLQNNGVTDNSPLEAMFERGVNYRATFDLLLLASFYNFPDTDIPIHKIRKIIVEFEEEGDPDFETWSITTSTSSTTSSTISTSSSTSTTQSTSSSSTSSVSTVTTVSSSTTSSSSTSETSSTLSSSVSSSSTSMSTSTETSTSSTSSSSTLSSSTSSTSSVSTVSTISSSTSSSSTTETTTTISSSTTSSSSTVSTTSSSTSSTSSVSTTSSSTSSSSTVSTISTVTTVSSTTSSSSSSSTVSTISTVTTVSSTTSSVSTVSSSSSTVSTLSSTTTSSTSSSSSSTTIL